MVDVNRLPLEGEGGLMDLLRTVLDPRQPRGVRHPVVIISGGGYVCRLVGCLQLPGDCRMGARAVARHLKALRLETLAAAVGTHDPAPAATTRPRPARCPDRPLAGPAARPGRSGHQRRCQNAARGPRPRPVAASPVECHLASPSRPALSPSRMRPKCSASNPTSPKSSPGNSAAKPFMA